MAEPNGATKSFGGVMAILAMIAGIAALWIPMNDRLGAMEKSANEHIKEKDHPTWQTQEITNIRELLEKHVPAPGHTEVRTKIASIDRELTEVETRFSHQDRLISLLWAKAYAEHLPEINSSHKAKE